MDIIRNVGVREQENEENVNFQLNKNLRLKRNSLPNIIFNETKCIEQEILIKSINKEIINQSICEYQTIVTEPNEEECAVSGRLEIRVVPQGKFVCCCFVNICKKKKKK